MVSWRSLKSVIVRALKKLIALKDPDQPPLGFQSHHLHWVPEASIELRWLTSLLSWAMAGTWLSCLCSCCVDRPRTYTAGNLSPERTSHMVALSCFQSCLWSCLLLLLLEAWINSVPGSSPCFVWGYAGLHCQVHQVWLGRVLPSECPECLWLLFPVALALLFVLPCAATVWRF